MKVGQKIIIKTKLAINGKLLEYKYLIIGIYPNTETVAALKLNEDGNSYAVSEFSVKKQVSVTYFGFKELEKQDIYRIED